MAACRLRIASAVRSFVTVQNQTAALKSIAQDFSGGACHSTRAMSFAPRQRLVLALGAADSLQPLHSAIASARLKSIIAVDSSCWSWLSQDFAMPR